MKLSRSALAAATLLFGLSTAIAQTTTPVRWTEGAPNATSELKNDSKIEGIEANDIHIFASIAELKDTEYNRVWLQIANHGKAPIAFDPQTALLLNGDKPVRPEVPEKAAKSITKVGEAKSQEMSGANCAMMNSSKGMGNGPCSPSPSRVQMGKEIAQDSAKEGEWVRENALQQKSINPGDEVQGAIVFRKDKRAADYVLRMQIGNSTFEFPLSAQNKRPSYD